MFGEDVVSVFGTVGVSCGFVLPLGEVEFGVLAGEASGTVEGACGAASGTVAPGVIGAGFVLLPPDGVCSFIGWLLCDCEDEPCDDELLDGACATTKPADNNASVAIYVNFFMIPGPPTSKSVVVALY